MNKQSYRHQGNYVHAELAGDIETPIGKSLTVPDQTMSLQELISRNVRGLPVTGYEPTYNEDYVPNLKTMDLVERQEYLDDLKQQNQQTAKELDARLQHRRKMKIEKEEQDEKDKIERVTKTVKEGLTNTD